MRVAYSNESFELWYLLHFSYSDACLTRRGLITRLTVLLGHPYRKNSETMYGELEHRVADAIQNAERLLDQYQPLVPANVDPSTTVHLLVRELLRFVR